MTNEERRNHLRRTPPSLMVAQCADKLNSVRDVSLGGSFIEGTFPVRVGEHLECKLWLSCYDSVEISVTVRRKVQGQGIGVEFDELKPENTLLLSKYIQPPPRWQM